jgi:hypothetical protein
VLGTQSAHQLAEDNPEFAGQKARVHSCGHGGIISDN